MKITQAFLDELTEKAKTTPRMRLGHDLRDTSEDLSQRMVNAIEPGSVISIHRHKRTSETMICVRGRIVVEIYDEFERICTESIELAPDGPVVAVNVPAGQWHTAHSLETGTAIIEMKDGKYEQTSDSDILKW